MVAAELGVVAINDALLLLSRHLQLQFRREAAQTAPVRGGEGLVERGELNGVAIEAGEGLLI